MERRYLKETSNFWHAPDIGEVGFLKANYITHSFPPHTHDGYVIGVIEHGAEVFEYNGKLQVAPQGSMVLVNPGEVHTGRSQDERGWAYRTFYPSTKLICQIDEQVSGTSSTFPVFKDPVIKDPGMARRFSLMHALIESSSSTIERQSVFTETMAKLIVKYGVSGKNISPCGREPVAVARVRDYINSNYAENISLDELASVADLSPYYLTRAFKKLTGMPPHLYLIQVRISRSSKMLVKGYPIASVAAATGFVDQSHFSRHFKKIIGVTPGNFISSRARTYKILNS